MMQGHMNVKISQRLCLLRYCLRHYCINVACQEK